MGTITWLHLSDIHFQESEVYSANIVLKALLHDVREHTENGLTPDLIIITGDIAFSGKADEYALAGKFLDDLLEATRVPKERLFIVPGNHDVDRAAISLLAEGATAILNTRDGVNRFLTNAVDRNLVFRKFHNYENFINSYLGQGWFDPASYFYVKEVELAQLRIAILGLNSAWLSNSDQDRNHLVLGESQVRAALNTAKNAGLRIAIMHHPLDWLQDFDRQDVEPLLSDGCDFLLHGHMHQLSLLQARTPDSESMLLAAGACYKTRQYPNSYNLVCLKPDAGMGTVYLRTYSDQRGGFWTKDVMNYRNVDDGEFSFPLPARLCRSPKQAKPQSEAQQRDQAGQSASHAADTENRTPIEETGTRINFVQGAYYHVEHGVQIIGSSGGQGSSGPPNRGGADNHAQDEFSPLETGTERLLARLGREHPRYQEACVYQERLIENVSRARLYGDSETSRAERNEIVGRLNSLALDTLGMPFRQVCATATPVEQPIPDRPHPAPELLPQQGLSSDSQKRLDDLWVEIAKGTRADIEKVGNLINSFARSDSGIYVELLGKIASAPEASESVRATARKRLEKLRHGGSR